MCFEKLISEPVSPNDFHRLLFQGALRTWSRIYSVTYHYDSLDALGQSQLTQMITPIVAKRVKEPFDRKRWFFELKWDGFRAITETDGTGGVKLYSRRHNDFKKRFPPIVGSLS
jgi:ATP-dependent DNA ligase